MKSRISLLCTLSFFLVAACSRPPAITSEIELEMNPSGRTPLAGILRFTTDIPSRATLTIGDGENSTTVRPDDAFTTEHTLMVLGLRPGRSNTIDIQIESERGKFGEPAQKTVQTEPLPDYFPPVDVVLSRPARMEPGVTLVTFSRIIDQVPDEEFGLILAFDAQGETVWAYEADHGPDEPRRLANGNLLYQDFNHGAYEIDMLGNMVNRWHATETNKPVPDGAIPIAIHNFHHDLVQMPSGNYLALSTEPREFEDYPTSEEDPEAPRETATVIGDVLVEFRPDGTVVRDWKFFDLLDPYRIGYDSLNTGFYEEDYEDLLEEPGHDWAHSNAVLYLPEEDAAIVSVKHQSTVLKLDLGEGNIEWMLGTPEGWKTPWDELFLEPQGDVTWFWDQHAPEITAAGTLMLFDNGSARALPPNPPLPPDENYSRAVEFRIDEANRTFEEVWSYGEPGENSFYSTFVCEADTLPQTGNVLINVGGQVRKPDGSRGEGPFDGQVWATIMEVTHTSPAERVWEIVIDDPAVSWIVYRVERMPDLYP